MNITIIVGDTRGAAREELKQMCNGSRIRRLYWYDEAMLNGDPVWAIEGEPDNTCFITSLGYSRIKEIIIVNPGGISEQMGKCIAHIVSTIEWQGGSINVQIIEGLGERLDQH